MASSVAENESVLNAHSTTVPTMASEVRKRLVVAGGNGFLGSRICKSAVARGWDVTSIRQAPPHFTGESR